MTPKGKDAEQEADRVTFRLERKRVDGRDMLRAWASVTIGGQTEVVDTEWQSSETFAIKLSAARALEKRGYHKIFGTGLTVGSPGVTSTSG